MVQVAIETVGQMWPALYYFVLLHRHDNNQVIWIAIRKGCHNNSSVDKWNFTVQSMNEKGLLQYIKSDFKETGWEVMNYVYLA